MGHYITIERGSNEQLRLTLTASGEQLAYQLLAERGNEDDQRFLEKRGQAIEPDETATMNSETMLAVLLGDELRSGHWTFTHGNIYEMHGSPLLIEGDAQAILDGLPNSNNDYQALHIWYNEYYAVEDPIYRLLNGELLLNRINHAF